MIQNIRILKIIVTILGLIIFIGLTIILITVGQRVGNFSEVKSPDNFSAPTGHFQLPSRAEILNVDLDDNRVLFLISVPGGVEQLIIFDLSSGEKLGLVTITRDE